MDSSQETIAPDERDAHRLSGDQSVPSGERRTPEPPAEAGRAEHTGADRVVRLGPETRWTGLLAEVRQHREILYFLVVRNLKVRYRQTVLGAVSAVAQPLALMLVFVVVGDKILNIPSEGVPSCSSPSPRSSRGHCSPVRSRRRPKPSSGTSTWSQRSTFRDCSCRSPRSARSCWTSSCRSSSCWE